MSLKHSLLVMLTDAPATGYDLSRQFKGGIGFFWNASHQQVYQQLAQMADAGWVTFATESQTDKPDRKVYAITRAGRAELDRWLAAPVAPNKLKDALLIKLYAGHLVDPPVLIEEVARHRAIHQHSLDKLKTIEQEYLAKSADEQAALRMPYLTLLRGISGEQAWLDWADGVLAELARRNPPKESSL